MKLYADYHTHTRYSHGKGSIRENIEAAIEKGLKEIAIADHGPASQGLTKLGVKDAATLLEIKKEVEKYDKFYPEIKVLSAVEANIINIDGDLDVPRFILKELDKVLVGFHLYIRPSSWKDGINIIFNNAIMSRLNLKQEEIRYKNTDILIKSLNKYKIDIITHPGYRVNIDTSTLAKAAVKRGTHLEINESHMHTTEEYLRIAVSEGAKFSLGSDAHAPEQVGCVDNSLDLATKAGLTRDDIINVC
ncbi:PHP domain-containing protein [Orenia marismortui]|uniref:PHP domain-containing protein n=1 Tax=Orenia marismortui TaxID=46469 RepID=UPI0003658A0A|nr:PHP domain-containing protein [Orenia marismortui]